MKDQLIILLFLGFIIFCVHITSVMYKDCSDKGGILIRGAIKYECVKSLEKL